MVTPPIVTDNFFDAFLEMFSGCFLKNMIQRCSKRWFKDSLKDDLKMLQNTSQMLKKNWKMNLLKSSNEKVSLKASRKLHTFLSLNSLFFNIE